MEYGRLIRDAWAMTWRHRFLWLLGVFAGGITGVGGGGGQWRTDQRELEQLSPEAGAALAAAGQWALDNLGLLIALGLLVVLLGLVFIALSLIAQGGMARATADLATGQPITPGQAWAAGLHLVWRYLGLWLLLALAAIGVAAVIGGGIALLVGTADALDGQTPGWLLFFIALGIPTILVGLVVGVGVSIIVIFAQRAIAVEDVGPLAALGVGWTLLRQHLGTSLLVWLLGLVLGIAAGIGIAAGAVVALIALTPIGVALWLAAGFTAPTIGYLGVALAVLLGAVLTLSGVANTFLWAYWTLAYLRLGGEPEPAF